MTADSKKKMRISNHVAGNGGTRTCASFPIQDFQYTKQQMLTWASPFNICCFLDSQTSTLPVFSTSSYNCLLAVGAVDQLECPAGMAIDQLLAFSSQHKDWMFGHFGYGLAKETEPIVADDASLQTAAGSFGSKLSPVPDGSPSELSSPSSGPVPRPSASSTDLTDQIGFPDLFFFIPETVIELDAAEIHIASVGDPEAIWRAIAGTRLSGSSPPSISGFTPRISREEYLEIIGQLQAHILRGDCYEINFCQEFYSQQVSLDPLSVWNLLSKASPNPFSTFYRLDQRYLFCASPERYLKKEGDRLFSQPIKGTAPRIPGDPIADEAKGKELFHSAKNRAENVMVVDLVRNDLSRICIPGTVEVTELFGVYAFPHVFQMISTITGRMPADLPWPEAIAATFPMGSMTGAPKKKVVSLIDRYERSRRGIFSGAVGYVTPSGDFDFNVVIRSLMYNQENSFLSYQVGSGITFYSNPEEEYEECMLKAAGIRKALQS